MGATLQTEIMKLIALFFCKLSKDSPAPPIVHAVTFDKAVQGTTTKRNYLAAVKAMQSQFKGYKYFKRLAIVQDLSDAIIPDSAQWQGEFEAEEI